MSTAGRYTLGVIAGVVGGLVCRRALAPFAPPTVVEFIAITVSLFCVLWAAQLPRPRSEDLPARIGVTLGASLVGATAGLLVGWILDRIWP